MKIFKRERRYYVVAKYTGGLYSWESRCSGFPLFCRPNIDLINEWKEYAKEKTGTDCIITWFQRID